METLVHGITKSVSLVLPDERKQMFDLLLADYIGVTEDKFNSDLDEKDGVMMMLDSKTLKIAGFSTFMLIDLKVSGNPVKAFFSGDTIVKKEYRRTTAIGVEIGKNFIAAVKNFSGHKIYWILISKGCRTYRILPIFFREWYPRYDCETPPQIKDVMHAFGSKKYPENYDAVRGLIVFLDGNEALKPGVADASESRIRDPHINFFVEKNPEHMRGDELVCAAEVSVDNFAPAFLRMLRTAGVKLDD